MSHTTHDCPLCESVSPLLSHFGPSLGTWGKVTVELPKHIEVNQCRPRWSAQWSCLPSPDTLQLVFPRNWESNKNIKSIWPEHPLELPLLNHHPFVLFPVVPSPTLKQLNTENVTTHEHIWTPHCSSLMKLSCPFMAFSNPWRYGKNNIHTLLPVFSCHLRKIESLTPSISVVKIWYQLAANPHAS